MPKATKQQQSLSDSSDVGSPIADSLSPTNRAARNTRAGQPTPSSELRRERTKDGCLTCRMRRKKCQTEIGDDGSCLTCRRLEIECYGFGVKRPDWMKNKDLLKEKLQEIKDHLIARGFVRGVVKDKTKEPRRTKDALSSSLAAPTFTSTLPGAPRSHLPKSPTISTRRPPQPFHPTPTDVTDPHIVPPIAPLSHPVPGRNNPQYPPSRQASRSPVQPHLRPRSPTVPRPSLVIPQTARPSQPAKDDSDESDDTVPAPRTPDTFTMDPSGSGGSYPWTSGVYHPNFVPIDSLLDGIQPHGVMSMPYGSHYDSSDPMADIADSSVHSYQYIPPIGPALPPEMLMGNLGVYSSGGNVFTSALGPAQLPLDSNDYYQDMENQFDMVLSRGYPPPLAATIVAESWQQSQSLVPLPSPISADTVGYALGDSVPYQPSDPRSETSSSSAGLNVNRWLASTSSALQGNSALSASLSSLSSSFLSNDNPYSATFQNSYASPRIRSLAWLTGVQEDGFKYYFDRVSGMQYIFDSSSTPTMHNYIRSDPNGVVATSIRMISAIHDAQYRKYVGLGMDTGYLRTNGTATELYNKVNNQIQHTMKLRWLEEHDSNANAGALTTSSDGAAKGGWGKVTEAEATAALHMISYWLFQGGDGKWAEPLKIAVHWFMGVDGLYTKRILGVIKNMTPQQKFAAKTTMWMDIFSSITDLRLPHLNDLYQHLLQTSSGSNNFFGTTNGCCDAVMFSLAAIVTLEVDIEMARSVFVTTNEIDRQTQMSLFHFRANKIRHNLEAIDCGTPRLEEVVIPAEVESLLVNDAFLPGSDMATSTLSHVPIPLLSTSPSLLAPGTGGSQNVLSSESSAPSSPTSSTASAHLTTSDVFRQAALVYLSIVQNGFDPNIPSTRQAVDATHAAVIALPPSKYDKSLVFPLCVAGCMTDDPTLRQFFSGRLDMNSPVGNCGKTVELMAEVWRRRDLGILRPDGTMYGWRDVMKETGLEILLV